MVRMICRLYFLFQIKRQRVLLLAALLKHGKTGPYWSVSFSAVFPLTVTPGPRLQEIRSMCLHHSVIVSIKANDFIQLVTLPSRNYLAVAGNLVLGFRIRRVLWRSIKQRVLKRKPTKVVRCKQFEQFLCMCF